MIDEEDFLIDKFIEKELSFNENSRDKLLEKKLNEMIFDRLNTRKNAKKIQCPF